MKTLFTGQKNHDWKRSTPFGEIAVEGKLVNFVVG